MGIVMGDIYFVTCTDCKVTRELGKLYKNGRDVETILDAIKHAGEVEKNSYKPALLVSFMARKRRVPRAN
jgi:hypothetical protein